MRQIAKALTLGACLFGTAACSTSIQEQSLFVAPGKYDFLTCKDIAQREVSATLREKELNSLMDRANQDAAGPLVNALVYSGDLAQVRAEQRLLRRTAIEKKCDEQNPPPQ